MIKQLFILLIFCIGCATSAERHPAFTHYINAHRTTYKAHFDEESYSPIKGDDLNDMQFYPPNRKYYTIASFKKHPDPETIEIPTYSGKKKEFYVYGILTFEIKKKKHNLNVYRSFYTMKIPEYQDHLFIPYKDLTNGDDTYGGGRYIDMLIPDIIGSKVILDFNKSYNPYCAYSDGYNCPIPPIENHMEIEVLAGEKMYTGVRRNRTEN